MSSTKCPPITTALEAELDAALHETLDENDALRAEIAALQAENRRLQDWIMGDEPDALTTLQRVYSDPQTDVPNVIKSASAALGYERSKPAAVVIQYDFKQRVYEARMKQMALDKARWAAEDAAKVIEHQPLDLDAPTGPTDPGPRPAGR
jgi:hypothetical protein